MASIVLLHFSRLGCPSREAMTGNSPGRKSGELIGNTKRVAKRRQEKQGSFDHDPPPAYQGEFSQCTYRAIFAKPRFELPSEYVFTEVDSDEDACRRVATENKLADSQPRTGIRGYRMSSLQDCGWDVRPSHHTEG